MRVDPQTALFTIGRLEIVRVEVGIAVVRTRFIHASATTVKAASTMLARTPRPCHRCRRCASQPACDRPATTP